MPRARLRVAAVALWFGLLHATSVAADRAFAWPHGARAAVSLAYDDALDSQLDHAVPALDRHGLKASFYLTLAGDSIARRVDDWRKVARAGHELGNHSLFHQCSRTGPGRDWVPDHRNLDTTSAARMRDQVLLANAVLHAIDGQGERTFTPPCGDLVAAGENYVDALKPAFVAIRTSGAAVISDMSALDPFGVGAVAYADLTGRQLIAVVEQAAARGTMALLTFHGVGGDHLAVSREAHDELLAHLAAHRHIYWTDTFIAIMRYVRAQPVRRAGSMPATSAPKAARRSASR
jgi:peptidoglycan/xylan/chitin deacetylase (PgdA/CDA1 family)